LSYTEFIDKTCLVLRQPSISGSQVSAVGHQPGFRNGTVADAVRL